MDHPRAFPPMTLTWPLLQLSRRGLLRANSGASLLILFAIHICVYVLSVGPRRPRPTERSGDRLGPVRLAFRSGRMASLASFSRMGARVASTAARTAPRTAMQVRELQAGFLRAESSDPLFFFGVKRNSIIAQGPADGFVCRDSILGCTHAGHGERTRCRAVVHCQPIGGQIVICGGLIGRGSVRWQMPCVLLHTLSSSRGRKPLCGQCGADRLPEARTKDCREAESPEVSHQPCRRPRSALQAPRS